MSTLEFDYDPQFIAAYESAEFENQYRAMVLAALRRIDRARLKLIEAQNELVLVLDGSNDVARGAFSSFYAAGGVTAADWAALDYTRSAPPRVTRRGQLRVVPRSTPHAQPAKRK